MENTIKRTECRGCGKFFVGTSVFDEHRIGSYGEAIHNAKGNVTGYTPHSRRCMTEEEMRVAGMDCEKKLVHIIIEGKNTYEEHDVWFMIAWRARAKSATYGKQTDEDEEEDNHHA